MPLPDKTLKYHEKNLLDHVIDQISTQEKEPTAADLNKVVVAAQVQAGIDKYRAEAKSMSPDGLRSEEHNSARLGEHLVATGKRRPPRCHAHAIVAGKHHHAAVLRTLMARLEIRIDDPDNGCWLPENTAATPHPAFPSAVPHSRIHRYNYFFWIRIRLSSIRKDHLFRKGLQEIARALQQKKFPSYVINKKGQDLPNGGRLS